LIKKTLVVALSSGVLITGVAVTLSRAQEPVSFGKEIRPLLEENCWSCHGAAMQASKLDLRTREGLIKGGTRGPAIVPGKGEQSRMYRVLAGLEQPAMPLGREKLSPAQASKVRAWIDEGAHWDIEISAAPPPAAKPASNPAAELENAQLPPGARDAWAYQLPTQAAVPKAGNSANPVDRFLAKDWQEKGLKAAPRADRATLVRRAYLDLIGLPPTPAQSAEFLADTSADAWPRLIDKLLASPHYGERWGRHWLDVARYADSSGYEYDYDRPNAWRYRDYVVKAFNDDKPFDRFVKEQIAGDELPDRNDESYIGTHFLRAGARVAFREKDNPERRFEYLDDIIATIGRGVLGLTVQCARCHNHKFDPILQRDYYAMQASVFGYVETTYPLTPKPEADAYKAKMAEIDAAVAPLRAEIKAIEDPVFNRLMAEAVRTRFPENIKTAFFKPENERSEGERLLVAQIPDAFFFDRLPVDQSLSPEEGARKKALNDQIKALEAQRPKPIPMAEIATDGDYRSAPNGRGDETIGCPQCRIPDPTAGPFVHTGPGKYQTPPSYFLVRGDVNSKGSRMKPGFVSVATYGNPPTELPPADGHTSGRRLALAEWLASRDNPLTARVMVNRIWAHHFGRGIVASLDNFGKMGEAPTHPELLDWLAVEFMNRGWSVKQMHRLMMTSQAYQMASAFEDDTDQAKDPENHFLWRYRPQRLDSDAVRDAIMTVSGGINLQTGGPPVYPPMPKELLESTIHNVWVAKSDGPEVWRRSLYVYRKRNLALPMLEAFDMPDPNITAGARTVSTVATQSLMLLNDEFVRRQAKLFAGRIQETAGNDRARQIELAYRIALTRPPDEREAEIANELIERQSLIDFAHVLLNLNEFVYMR
jgi:hypothetical protein